MLRSNACYLCNGRLLLVQILCFLWTRKEEEEKAHEAACKGARDALNTEL